MGRQTQWRHTLALTIALSVAPGMLCAQPAQSATEASSGNGLTRPQVAPDASIPAEEWLARMNSALASSAFSGTFVFLRDGQLDTLRIEHRPAAGGAEGESRLYSVSGESIEAATENGALRLAVGSGVSLWPSTSSVTAAIPRSKQPPPAHYDVLLGAQDRVAGRQAQVIEIRPHDGFRYGYRLWLDVRSALLLKSVTMGSDGRAVEQLMFTALETEAGLPNRSSAADPAFGSGEGALQDAVARASAASSEPALWRVLDVPEGFAPQVVAGGAAAHLFFSDGVAHVSVYVEPLVAAEPTLSGLLSRGALNAYGRVAHGSQIIAMGDAPAATIERFAQGVVPFARGVPVRP